MTTAVSTVSTKFIEQCQVDHTTKAALEQLQAQITAVATATSHAPTKDGNDKVVSFA
jgi:hypothetical protein